MPRYVDLVAQLVPILRALPTPQGQTAPMVDEGRLEQSLFHALQQALTLADLDAFTVFDTALFTTQTGVRTYPLPVDFGRLLNYREPRQTGVRCSDGVSSYEITQELPLDLAQSQTSTNGRPGRFCMTAGGMSLDPPPDSNSGSSYTIRATYLQQINLATFDMTQEVRAITPQALLEAAQAHYLGQDMRPALSRLLFQNAKNNVELQWQYSPQRWRRWRRRGRM